MKRYLRIINAITISAAFLIISSCEKEVNSDPKSTLIFSVDLNNSFFYNGYSKCYIAAYTPEGLLLGFGNLTDSSKWDLSAKYSGDKIDFLYIEIWHNKILKIQHTKNIPVGETFSSPNRSASTILTAENRFEMIKDSDKDQQEEQRNASLITMVLKVEDFGNRVGNTTAISDYESLPRFTKRGISYYEKPTINWDKVENGFTYYQIYADIEPTQWQLCIFERGTNKPYFYSISQKPSNFYNNDTLTINKSDFIAGEVKTTDFTIPENKSLTTTFRTFNVNGDGRLTTSFDKTLIDGNNSAVKHTINTSLPINKWELIAGSYSISSTNPIPSTLGLKRLTGVSINKVGSSYELTHSSKVSSVNFARSSILFRKEGGEVNNYISFDYLINFDSSTTTGTTTFKLFEIPPSILADYTGFKELNDSKEWYPISYEHIYTDIPGNSPIDIFIYGLSNYPELKKTATGNYTYETISIVL